MTSAKRRGHSSEPEIARLDRTSSKSAKSKQGNKDAHIEFLGFNVSALSSNSQFLFLAVGHVICAMIFAATQEMVFKKIDKSHSQLVTLVTQFVLSACALLERFIEGDMEQKSPTSTYLVLSFMTTAGMYFTNWSLSYLSYPARIIFKSAKPLPTMAVEAIYGGKSFQMSEYLMILILTTGISFFCFGEVNSSPQFEWLGIFLISIGVVADALTSNYEKKQIFSKYDAGHAEVMFFASFFGMIITACTMGSGLPEQLHYLYAKPDTFLYISISAFGCYFSVSFVLLLIKAFGPTYAETVKGFRKVCSIGLSYAMLGNKSPGAYHYIGIFFFILSILFTIQMKAQKSSRK